MSAQHLGQPASQPRSFVRPSWCEVDLGAVAANLAQVRELAGPGVAVFICLKCDAFGCGAPAVALAAEAAGAAGLAFGDVDAALACREAGVRLPMLLYPSCLPEAAPLLRRQGLMPTLSTLDDVAAWDAAASAATGGAPRLPVFLKVDCGGARAGALPRQAVLVAQAIAQSRHLALAGVYGHTLDYGLTDPVYAHAQFASFQAALALLAQAGLTPPLRMFSSSETFLSEPRADLNAIDPGRLLLGMSFPAAPARQRAWRPALVGLKSRLVMCKPVEEEAGVLYAPFFERRPGMRIGLIPLGWSDGFPRRPPDDATALVRGRRVPLLGPVHAELLRVDLSGVPEARVGDEVVLLGRSGDEHIGLRELCAQWRAEEIDVYTGIVDKLPKVYLQPAAHKQEEKTNPQETPA